MKPLCGKCRNQRVFIINTRPDEIQRDEMECCARPGDVGNSLHVVSLSISPSLSLSLFLSLHRQTQLHRDLQSTWAPNPGVKNGNQIAVLGTLNLYREWLKVGRIPAGSSTNQVTEKRGLVSGSCDPSTSPDWTFISTKPNGVLCEALER